MGVLRSILEGPVELPCRLCSLEEWRLVVASALRGRTRAEAAALLGVSGKTLGRWVLTF